MPDLFHFVQRLPIQSDDIAYGVQSNINMHARFRVTSSFEMTNNVTAYAMLPGTILLQQQTNADKVNLILKPNRVHHR